MKIALIDPSVFTWPYDSELAFALHQAGHEVRIFGKPSADAESGPALPLLVPHFYRFLNYKLVRQLPKPVYLGLKGISHIVGMLHLWFSLLRWRPDVIHFQWVPLPVVDRFFLPMFRWLAPTVMTVHDSSPFNSAPIPRLQAFGARAIWSHFDHLIAHTHRAIETLKASGIAEDKLSQIAHGPLGGAASTVKVNHLPNEAGAPVRILLFGRLREYKGPDVLLRAVASMPRGIQQMCKVRIVGEALMPMEPLNKIIEDADIGDCVSLESHYIPEADVGNVLSMADIIVLPYREIDASGVLMMCLSAGVPIVASKIGLFEEMLVDGVHGLLTPIEDHVALSKALEQLIVDPERRERMGDKVRQLRQSIPDWPGIAQSTAALYENLGRPGSAKGIA